MTDIASLTPISGYKIDGFHPMDPILRLINIFVALPLYSIGLVAWLSVFFGIRKARLLDDPNYILIVSLGCADLTLLISALSLGISSLINNGFLHGFLGKTESIGKDL
jgi:hypothetical protein